MEHREEAIALLRELRDYSPRVFFQHLDRARQGIGFVLVFLEKAQSPVTPGDIAREWNVTTARIAAVLGKMEKQGLITRSADPLDARRTIVNITPEGRKRACELRAYLIGDIEILLEKVGAEDLKQFLRISKKINDALM